MRAFDSKRGWAWAGAFGLFAVLAAVPSNAHAGCRLAHTRPVIDVDLLRPAGQGSASWLFDRITPPTPADAPGPCPGGECSSERPAPISSPPPTPPRTEQWPVLTTIGDMPRPESAFSPFDEPSGYVLPTLSSLERPPRISERSLSS